MIPTEKIEYIEGKMENGKIIDWEKIHKEYNKLIKGCNAPEDIYKFDDIPWKLANLFVIFSKRDTGKTTNALLHGLIAYRLYGVKTEWVRQVSDMIKPTNIASMFDTIISHGYIQKITKGRFSSVYYYRKEMFLCNYEDGEKGRPSDIDEKPFLRFHSIDNMQEIKSNYTSENGDLIFLDEFQKRTNREGEFEDFFHIVSTIKRRRISTKIFFLGNTITPYNYYFREMDITKYIIKMKPNDKLLIKTVKGMNIYLEWTQPTFTDKKKSEKQRLNELQYYGFEGLNSITGDGTWDVKTYPHITAELDKNKTVLDELYIEFVNYTLNAKLCYNDDFGEFVFVRPCHEKTLQIAREHGKLILTDRYITRKNEVFGTGRQFKKLLKFWSFMQIGRMLFTTNDVGALTEEFYETFK